MWDSNGRKSTIFKTSALNETKEKINEMNESDCHEQVSFIKTAILVIKDSYRKHKVFDINPRLHVFNPKDFFKKLLKLETFLLVGRLKVNS